jgi:hypothetical protein
MVLIRRATFTCVLGVVICSPSFVRAGGSKPAAPVPVTAGLKESEGGMWTSEQPIVAVQQGKLTVRIKNSSLESLLDQVSGLSGIGFVAPQGMGTERISLNLQDLPLEEALRQILSNHDTFFLWVASEQPGKPASLKGVWIYPKGKGRILQPLPPEEWASSNELREKLGDPDPRARAAALEGLIERIGQRAQEEVLQALRDSDAHVRSRALFCAEDHGLHLPSSILKDLEISDSSPEVRFLALQGLQSDPNIEDLAHQALSDPDPHVRAGAQELLNSLKPESEPADSGSHEQSAQPDSEQY